MHTIVETERLSGRTSAPAERGAVPSARAWTLVQRIVTWMERARQRQALLALDDWVLRDIGLSRADVVREGDKPFWQE